MENSLLKNEILYCIKLSEALMNEIEMIIFNKPYGIIQFNLHHQNSINKTHKQKKYCKFIVMAKPFDIFYYSL